MAKGRKYAGRVKGTPNKTTVDVREAFAALLKGNAGQINGWLNSVATGEQEPARKRDGEQIVDGDNEPVMRWLRPPNPGYALELVMGIAEYHIPKLARTELTGANGERLMPPATIIIKTA